MLKPSIFSIGLLLGAGSAAQARPLTIHDVVALSRIGAADVSPDGRSLVWEQRETDLAANRGRTGLWRLDLSKTGAKPERLTADSATNEAAPAFSPDGRWIFFTSEKDGRKRLWRIAAAGGAAEQLSEHEIEGFKIAPTGDRLLVWADRPVGATSLAATARVSDRGGSARTYDGYFFRHWDSWADGRRSQIFVLPLVDGRPGGDGVAIGRGLVGDTPSKPFGEGNEIAWSRDGRTIYFALREAGTTEPLSTNLDIFAAPADASAAPVNLTEANDATDTLPTVSPDGRWLAYVAMKRPTYEADRQVVQLRDLRSGRVRSLTEGWDRSVTSLAWSRDGRTLYVTAPDVGDEPAFAVDIATGKPTRISGAGTVAAVLATPESCIVALNTLAGPTDFYRCGKGGAKRLTAVNADKLAGVDMPGYEHFSFKGARGDTVWAYVVKPAGLAPRANVPIAFLIHGGPQSSFGNSWSYRWNPAVFAGAGYGVVMVDFHGSVGYGQAFTDAINRDWGGAPLEDLRLGLAAATARFGWLDGSRACAAGGSYGGYMVNWIASQWNDGFKCLVSHAGVFDARAMAYETEELWFDEWEHGGPYYEAAADYERWNPVNHVTAWRTPMLFIHGEKDFRIPYTQGIAAFTAAQRRGVTSRLVVYPDENHWILKPRNSIQWYDEVLGWMDRYTKR